MKSLKMINRPRSFTSLRRRTLRISDLAVLALEKAENSILRVILAKITQDRDNMKDFVKKSRKLKGEWKNYYNSCYFLTYFN